MAVWSDSPPAARSSLENLPTLLFSWWCTIFSTVIILVRICGRKIRSNGFFREDKVMALSLIPLFIRMGLIHVVLIYGTNNVVTTGLTNDEINKRSIGSRLVLAARIFYALFIWMSKFTVSEFLKRTFYNTWRQSYEYVLRSIRVFLGITFLCVIVATLSECQPFDHYWQVIPDPGPRCRQGFAQLITMGTTDIITDILLILFPIPIILRSQMTKSRRFFVCILFSVNVLLICITSSRIPKVIEAHGRQQYRTVWASLEILISTFVSNGVIVGTFIRDKGIKKNKYRHKYGVDSIERAKTRRLTRTHTCDSDENLFRSIGIKVPSELMLPHIAQPVPAQPVFEISVPEEAKTSKTNLTNLFINTAGQGPSTTNTPSSPANLYISDVGGLLDSRSLTVPEDNSQDKGKSIELHDVGGLLK